jgi:radical SAM superfamily enzyme YgiQ (UPF0313 family)
MTFTFHYALDLARAIKQHFALPIIIGGPHVTIYPREVLSHTCFDIGVIGEGERTLLEIVSAYAANTGDLTSALSKIKGIVFRNREETCVTGPREFIADIDNLPFPAYDLLPLPRYYGCNLAVPYMTMMTSRGCPYTCSFCSKTPWGQSLRCHSARRVVDEIEYLVKELGIKAIDFFDDTFTANKERIREIASLIRERELHFEFGITTRVNTVDQQLLRDLKSIGCKTAAFGVESGDPDILKKINKNITIEQIKNAFRWTEETGINSVGFLMVGNPGETEGAIKNTIRLLKEARPDYFISNILIPYPGSALYADLLAQGILKEDYWKKVTLEGTAYPTPIANTTIPRNKLISMRNRINRMPYLRIGSNLLKLRKIRTIHDLLRSFHTLKTSLFGRTM